MQGERPTTKKMEIVDMQSAPLLSTNDEQYLLHQSVSFLQLNSFKTEDSWILFGDTTEFGTFYQFHEKMTQEILAPADDNLIYKNIFYLE